MAQNVINRKIDVRELPPKRKHATIFESFKQLEVGQTMQLISDHNPKPFYYQFDYEFSGTFDWVYIEEGPEVWKINITKVLAQ